MPSTAAEQQDAPAIAAVEVAATNEEAVSLTVPIDGADDGACAAKAREQGGGAAEGAGAAAAPSATGTSSADKWKRTRGHPLYPQLLDTLMKNSEEGLSPSVRALREPRQMEPPTEQLDSKDMTDSIDDFVKGTLHGIAQNTKAQNQNLGSLRAAGSSLLAALEQPLDKRMQAATATGPQPSQQDLKRLFMEASAKIQQNRATRGSKRARH